MLFPVSLRAGPGGELNKKKNGPQNQHFAAHYVNTVNGLSRMLRFYRNLHAPSSLFGSTKKVSS